MTMEAMERGAFTTADAGEAADTLTRLIGRAQVQAPAAGAFELALSWTVAGPLMVRRAQVGTASTVCMGVDAPQAINIAQVRAGRMTVRTGREHRSLDGDPYLMPQQRFTSTMEATDLAIFALDRVWVQDFAGELLQRDDFRLVFTGATARTPETAEYWRATAHHLREEVLTNDEAINVALIRLEALRRAATAVLWCFPSTFAEHAVPDQSTSALSGPIRRAVSYIDEHLGEPLDLAQIAAAARLPAHRLVTAFRQHLGTTPGAYLRMARLDAAHHDLLNADPTGGDTVGAIARRWGFTNLARFATEYHDHYRCTPTSTLHS